MKSLRELQEEVKKKPCKVCQEVKCDCSKEVKEDVEYQKEGIHESIQEKANFYLYLALRMNECKWHLNELKERMKNDL